MKLKTLKKVIFIIFLLNLIIFLKAEVNAAILGNYGKDYFGEEYATGYIRDREMSDIIRTSSGVSFKTGKELNSPYKVYHNNYFFCGTNTNKSEYVDYLKAARYINSNGELIWLDMRMYIWTNNKKYPWTLRSNSLSYMNIFSASQQINFEMHFYTVGHCGESNYEQSFKGVTRLTDLDPKEGFMFYSGYNKFYLQSGIPIISVFPGNKNSTNTNNPFSTSGNAAYSYFFGTRNNNSTDNIWVEINSTSAIPLKMTYAVPAGLGTAIGYTGTSVEYYIDGVLKETSYCVPYGKYKLINPDKNNWVKTGYTIDGWYTNTNYNVKAQDGIAGECTIRFYGRYISNYTVKYNGNGATGGSTDDSFHIYNQSKNLTTNGFKKEYTVTYNHNYEDSKNVEKVATCKFKNWNTNPNGTGTEYDNTQSVINLTSTAGGVVNMYAMWENASISYIPEREGYSFCGWYLDSECTAKVTDNEYTPVRNTTLYAKWEKDYTITVDNEKEGHTYNSYQIFQGTYHEKEEIIIGENGEEKIIKVPILSNIEWSSELQKEVENGKTHGDKILELLKENEKDIPESNKLYSNCKTAEDIAKVLQGKPNDGDAIKEFTDIVGKYILENNIPITKGTSTVVEGTDSDGNIDKNYKITHLEPGYYIVIDAKANEKNDAYSRYLIDVVQDVTMEPKTSIPRLNKKVKGNNIKTLVSGVEGESSAEYVEDEKRNTATYKKESEEYNAEDYDIEFELKSYIPDVTGYNTYKFEIVDILVRGFDYDKNSVKVMLGQNLYSETRTNESGETENNYTVRDVVIDANNYETYKTYFEEEEKTYPEGYAESNYGKTLILIEINDLVEQVKEGIVEKGQDIFIRYNAKLNGKGEVGTTSNINEAYVKYSNDPYHNDKVSQTTKETTYTYTIDLELIKIAELKDESSILNYLEGAEFEIYNKPETDKERKTIATVTTNELGTALYSSLGKGTYYIKETKSPEGYNKLREEIVIEIRAVCNEYGVITWTVEDKTNSNLVLVQMGVKDGTSIPEVKLQVENTSGLQLPVTGGTGTSIFKVVGISIILFVLVSFKENKRK